MSRFLRIFLASTAALLLAALVVGGFMLWRLTDIAGAMFEGALAARGFEHASVTVDRIGLDAVHFGAIRLDGKGDISASRTVIHFQPRRLLSGRLDGAEVEGLRLAARLTADGVSLGPIDALLAGGQTGESGGGGSFTVNLIGKILLTEARVSLETPVGPLALTANGDVTLTENLGTIITAKLGAAHDQATLSGDLDLAVLGGAVNAAFQVHKAESWAPALSFAGASAQFRFVGPNLAAGTLQAEGRVTSLAVQGAPLGDVRLDASLKDGRLDGHLDLEGERETGAVVRLDIEADDLRRPEAEIRIAGEAASTGIKGNLPVGMSGQGGFRLVGNLSSFRAISAMASGAQLAPDARLRGRFDAAFLDVSVPETATDMSLAGAIEITVADGKLAVGIPAALSVDVTMPSRRRHAVTLRSRDDKQPALVMGPTLGDAYVIGVGFQARPDGLPTVSGHVDARVTLDAAGQAILETAEVVIDAVRQRYGNLDLALSGATLAISSASGGFDGSLKGRLALSGTMPGDIGVDAMRIDFAGDLSQRGDLYTFRPQACAGLKLKRLLLAGVALSPGPMQVCPPSVGGGVAARVDLAADGGPMAELRFSLTSSAFSGAPAGTRSTATAAWHGTTPRVSVAVWGGLDGRGWRGKVEAGGGEIIADDLLIGASGLELYVEFDAGKKGTRAAARLNGLNITDRRRQKLFLPLGFSGTGSLAGQGAKFELAAKLAPDVVLSVKGTHDLAHGRGEAMFVLPPVTLAPTGFSINKLTPLAAGVLTDVAGRVEADGQFAWSARGITSSGRLAVKDLAAGMSQAQFAGIEGELRFSDILALKTDKEQTLRIGFLDAGIPLVGGEIVYAMDGDDAIKVISAQWPFAGGRIGAANVTVGFDGAVPDITFGVDGIDTAELLKLADIAGLQGGGRLSGSIPLRMEKDGPAIRGARVASTGGGTVRYRSAEAGAVLAQGGNSGEILAKALNDFRYSRLEFTFDGPLSGEIRARVALAGNNPAVYDGKRIELNVDLQGDLRDLVQSGSVIKDLPENIRRRITGGG